MQTTALVCVLLLRLLTTLVIVGGWGLGATGKSISVLVRIVRAVRAVRAAEAKLRGRARKMTPLWQGPCKIF